VGRIARGWDLSIKSFALIERQRRLRYPLVSLLLAELDAAARPKRRVFGRS
jgi:hypothetical protein